MRSLESSTINPSVSPVLLVLAVLFFIVPAHLPAFVLDCPSWQLIPEDGFPVVCKGVSIPRESAESRRNLVGISPLGVSTESGNVTLTVDVSRPSSSFRLVSATADDYAGQHFTAILVPSLGLTVEGKNVPLTLLAGETATLTFRCKLPSDRDPAGCYPLEVRVLPDGALPADAAIAAFGISIGSDGSASITGYRVDASTGSEILPAPASKASADTAAVHLAAEPGAVTTKAIWFTVTGHATYWDDNAGVARPIAGALVTLWDRDIGGADDLMGQYETDASGYFSIGEVSSLDSDDLSPGQVDVYAQVLFDFPGFSVKDGSGSTYVLKSQTIADVSITNVTLNLELARTNPSRPLGLIHNALRDSIDFMTAYGFFRNKIEVRWPSSEGTDYVFGYQLPGGAVVSERINIAASAQWRRAAVMHEYGHAVMMALYGMNYSNWPVSSGDPNPHYVDSVSSSGFAIREGFAEFFPCLVDGSALNLTYYLGVNDPNVETNVWWKGPSGTNTDGAIVEGAVASILWDMVDSNASIDTASGMDDDQVSGQFARILEVLGNDRPKSITAFWDAWLARGFGLVTEMQPIFDGHGVKVTLPANNPPTVMVTKPSSVGEVATGLFTIEWNSYDPDGDTLTVDLYYDRDDRPGGVTMIAPDVGNTGKYSWNPAGVTPGTYYLYAVVKDSKGGSGSDYSTGTVNVNYNGNPPAIDPEVPPLSADAGEPIRIDLTPFEKDPEEGETGSVNLKWTVLNLSNATVSGQESDDDVLTFTPSAGFTGLTSAILVLTDSGGKTATQTIEFLWSPKSGRAVTVSAISTAMNVYAGYPVTALTDGKKSFQKDFAAIVRGEPSGYLILDLGRDTVVSRMNLYNDGEYGAPKVVIEASVAETPNDFRSIGTFLDLDVAAGAPRINSPTFRPFLARFVKLTFSSFHASGWFQLNEIEVYGESPASKGFAAVSQAASDPAAVTGKGPEKLHDGQIRLNDDFAARHGYNPVTVDLDLGKSCRVFGLRTVNDGYYGARKVKVLGASTETSEFVFLAMAGDLKVAVNTPVDNDVWFLPSDLRRVRLVYSNPADGTYLQINETWVFAEGGTDSGLTRIDPVSVSCSQGAYPGFGTSKLTDRLTVYNGDFVVKNRGTGISITFDFGADKIIGAIRAYNDGEYGARKVDIRIAAASAPTGFTLVNSFSGLNVTPGAPNLDIIEIGSVTARLVRLDYSDFADLVWFQLNETAFYGPTGQGSGSDDLVAIASASSSLTPYPGFDAASLYNGLKAFNSDFAVKNSGAIVEILIDLGSDASFGSARIYNDGEFGGRTVKVHTAPSAAPGTFTLRGTFTGLSATPGSPTPNMLSLGSVTGRYLKFVFTSFADPVWFQLNEIEILSGTSSSDVEHQVASVASTVTAYSGYGAEKAADGVRRYNGDFACRHAAGPVKMTFDLGADRKVSSIVHVNDGEFGAHGVVVKYARASNPDVFISVGTFAGLHVSAGSPNEDRLTFQEVTGRYFRLEYSSFSDPVWFQLNEVDFIGSAASSQPAEAFQSSTAMQSLFISRVGVFDFERVPTPAGSPGTGSPAACLPVVGTNSPAVAVTSRAAEVLGPGRLALLSATAKVMILEGEGYDLPVFGLMVMCGASDPGVTGVMTRALHIVLPGPGIGNSSDLAGVSELAGLQGFVVTAGLVEDAIPILNPDPTAVVAPFSTGDIPGPFIVNIPGDFVSPGLPFTLVPAGKSGLWDLKNPDFVLAGCQGLAALDLLGDFFELRGVLMTAALEGRAENSEAVEALKILARKFANRRDLPVTGQGRGTPLADLIDALSLLALPSGVEFSDGWER